MWLVRGNVGCCYQRKGNGCWATKQKLLRETRWPLDVLYSFQVVTLLHWLNHGVFLGTRHCVKHYRRYRDALRVCRHPTSLAGKMKETWRMMQHYWLSWISKGTWGRTGHFQAISGRLPREGSSVGLHLTPHFTRYDFQWDIAPVGTNDTGSRAGRLWFPISTSQSLPAGNGFLLGNQSQIPHFPHP